MTPTELRERRRRREQTRTYLDCAKKHEQQVREAAEAQAKFEAEQAAIRYEVDVMLANSGNINAMLRVLRHTS